MARKNSRVRQQNQKGRLNRRQKGQAREIVSLAPNQGRVEFSDIVVPDGHCPRVGRRPKARFATPAKAAKALTQAQQQRARVGSSHVEKRYYLCPIDDCGGYHLTSREFFDEKAWKKDN